MNDRLIADTRRLIGVWEERPQDTRWEAEATIVLERWLAQAEPDPLLAQLCADADAKVPRDDDGRALILRMGEDFDYSKQDEWIGEVAHACHAVVAVSVAPAIGAFLRGARPEPAA